MKKAINRIRPFISNDIDLSNTWQVIKWCVELRCNSEKLQMAVDKVGTSPDAVREYLKRGVI